MMKLNKDKNIGWVLFIVEGGRTEFSVAKGNKRIAPVVKTDYIDIVLV